MLSGSRLRDSYIAMLHTDMTTERRAELWEKAKDRFPQLAALLLEEFDRSAGHEDRSSHDRLLGSTFMFLSLVNALEADPIVSWGSPPARSGATFPAFGFLKPLTNK